MVMNLTTHLVWLVFLLKHAGQEHTPLLALLNLENVMCDYDYDYDYEYDFEYDYTHGGDGAAFKQTLRHGIFCFCFKLHGIDKVKWFEIGSSRSLQLKV